MRNLLKILAGALVAMLLFQNCQKSDFLVITGVVRDSITNMPIEGAAVFSQGGVTFTASDGTFTIEGIQPGKNTFLVASLDGYNQNYKYTIISDGRVNKIDFLLSPFEKPEIETGRASNITLHAATVAGSLLIKDEISIYQYGHCWSSSITEPTIGLNDNYTSLGSTSGNITFSSNLSNLESDKVYYVRAYAYTSVGYVYGNSVAFKTSETVINGLINSYSFTNGNYGDDSGSNFYTYYYWYPPTYVADRFGVPNNAAEFSGVNYSGLYLNSYATPYEFEDFAISLWFNKPGSWENASQKLFTIGYPWISGGIRAYISQGAPPDNFYFGITVNGIDNRITLASYPSADSWHHLVAQRKGSKLQLYMDGNLAGETNCTTGIINNYDGWMFIGFTWLQEHFRGKMDDVKLYDKALTSPEINYLRNH